MIKTKESITPGPWRLAKAHEFPWRIDGCGFKGENTLTIIGGGGYGVLSVPYSITDGPNIANARLMASAPDIFAALVSLVDKIEKGYVVSTDPRIDIITQAKAALSKLEVK